MKVVRLSALRICHIYPTGDMPDNHLCYGRIRSIKNSSNSTGNRPLDLPAFSEVPQ